MTTIKLRRGTAAEWTASNAILAAGEMGVEIDTNKYKIGDGVKTWAQLNYFVDQATLNIAYAWRWQPTTEYTAGQIVIAPDGSVVKRLTSGTSGLTYNSASWQTIVTVVGTQAQTELAAVLATYAAKSATVTDSVTALEIIQNNGTDLQSYAVHESDNAGNAGILHKMHHYGTGYAIDVQNLPGAGSAFVVHQYGAVSAGIQLDNCAGQPMILMRNTQNTTLAPGTQGTGAFFDLLTDVGTVGTPNVQRHGQLDKDINFVAYQATKPWTFRTATGIAADALKVTQAEAAAGLRIVKSGTDTSSSNAALYITNSTGTQGIKIDQTGLKAAFEIATTSGAAGVYPMIVAGQDYGPKFTTSTDTHDTLTIQKNGTGTGRAVLITNKGTGNSIEVADASTTRWILDSFGKVVKLNNATVTITAGAGTPEASVTAPVGSLYLRTDGGTSTSHYIKESGTGNTGWVAK